MKKIALIALATSAAAIATPAAAQVTGTVDVTGSVAGRCSVVLVAGGAGTSTFNGTIALGALDDADGTLKDTLQGTTSAAAAGSYSTRVICNSANTNIDITADTLDTGSGTPPTGYSREIDYTAEMEVALAPSGSGIVKYNTLTPVLADHTKTVGRIAAGAANNVTVRAYGFAAKGGVTSVLQSGDYTSTITVHIAPGA